MADILISVAGNFSQPRPQPISFLSNASALGLGLLRPPDHA